MASRNAVSGWTNLENYLLAVCLPFHYPPRLPGKDLMPDQRRRLAVCLILGVAGVLMPSVPRAQATPRVLLTVDPTDPGFVLITATGAAPLADDSTYSGFSGVTLFDLFAADADASTFTFGDLAARGAAPYERAANASVGPRDLNLFNNDSRLQQFSTAAPAFDGVLTPDLTGATFRPAGSTGNIRAGFALLGYGPVLGQYQIIPEPSSAALLGLGGLALLRRRRA